MSNVQLDMVTASIPEPVAAPAAATGASVASAATPLQSAATSPSPGALLVMARQIGEILKSRTPGLDYRIDMAGDAPGVRVIESPSGVVVREIPSGEVLAVFQSLERNGGLLVGKSG